MSGTRPRVRFKERTELLDFLLEVSALTAETLDLDELLARVGEIVKGVVPFDLFAILLLSEKRKDLRIRYAVGHREEVVRNLTIPLGEGIVGAAVSSRQPVLVTDVSKDDRYLSVSDIVRSELCVPMIARGRVVGVMDTQSSRLGAFKEEDRTIMRLIATRVAAAIDNAQLYRRAERQYRTIRTLSKISNEFSSILELEELLAKVATSVRGLINYDAFSIYLVDEERTRLNHHFSIRYDERVKVDSVPLGKGITGAAFTSREIVRVHDTAEDARYISRHPGILSEIAVPLIQKHRAIGVMDLESERIGHFTEEHARTLGLLAPSVAIAVENARLYQELGERERAMQADLKAAFELQTVILPQKAPAVEGLDIAIGLRPARQISGDLYDFFAHPDGHFVVAFGDSSGKGAAAALYGAMLSGLMRTLAPHRRSPAELMKALNDELANRHTAGKYATLALLLWHPHSREFTIANAGGSPPMVLRDHQPMNIDIEGVPLGLLAHRNYEETVFKAEPGDMVVLYSDGVSDHVSTSGEEYGRHGLAQLLGGCHDCSPTAIVQAIFADLDKFNTDRFDDQTLIVMRVQ
ncbi:MAG: serine phosphatase [Bryobacterales bacterium]|nr:serine phosphatase [Bryobacterales bacterium]